VMPICENSCRLDSLGSDAIICFDGRTDSAIAAAALASAMLPAPIKPSLYFMVLLAFRCILTFERVEPQVTPGLAEAKHIQQGGAVIVLDQLP